MAFGLPELELKSGRKIVTDSIFVDETYGGLIEGLPYEEMNREHLARLPEKLERCFGPNRPVYVIPPKVKRWRKTVRGGVIKVAEMPPLELMVCFTSDEPIAEEYASSYLYVFWHQYTLLPLIPDFIRIKLERLNWNRLAVDAFP